MTYFSNFGYIQYDYTIKSDPVPIKEVIVDISQRVDFYIDPDTLDNLCDDVVIQDKMTPEKLAHTIYGNSRLHWTILYVNNITSLYANWPMSSLALGEFVTAKYGAGNEYNLHHYEKLPEGIWMDIDFINTTYPESEVLTVSNYLYEDMLNEQKRLIKVIKPEFIPAFITSFEKANNV